MNAQLKRIENSRLFIVGFAFVMTVIVMTIYEGIKEIAFSGSLTHWESHLITIAFTSLLAALSSWLVSKRILTLQLQIQDIQVREERDDAHRVTMGVVFHYLNNALHQFQYMVMLAEKGKQIDESVLDGIKKNIKKTAEELKELGEMKDVTDASMKKFVDDRL